MWMGLGNRPATSLWWPGQVGLVAWKDISSPQAVGSPARSRNRSGSIPLQQFYGSQQGQHSA